MSYKGSNDERKLEMGLVVNQNNNNYNGVSDSESDNDDKSEENLVMWISLKKSK